MRLVGFSVENYRSITKTEYIPTSNFTVLIGQNNEGKSNILAALVTAMQMIRYHAQESDDIDEFGGDNPYSWTRDFPIQFQKKPGTKITTFRVEFFLNEDERALFKNEIGVSLNGHLPISITIQRNEEPSFKVVKSGKNTKSLERKSAKIADFIGKRITINYIPTIRTEEESSKIIQRMLSLEMAKLEKDEEYKQSIELINRKQFDIFGKLSENLTASIKYFLPQVKSIEVKTRPSAQIRAIRSAPAIFIDDGTRTNIRHKGDGIKSVVALSLFQQQQTQDDLFTILAIEEPESHLHPGAIHSLRQVLQSMSSEKQIFITTHCPSLVNRDDVASNIIVKSNKATSAKKISEIREVLGVIPSDNLMNASLALLVEGADDKIVLDAYFKHNSSTIHNQIKTGNLIIEAIGGASKLPYKTSLTANEICSVHTFLDHDREGISARDKAIEQGTLKVSQSNMAACQGLDESEFEDMFLPSAYTTEFIAEYGVDLNRPEFKDKRKKWSDRVKACFVASTKPWGDRIESESKLFVAKLIASKIEIGIDVLHPHRGKPLKELVLALEQRLSK